MVVAALGDVASIHAGFSFRGSIPEVPDGKVHVVQMRDINPDRNIDWSGVMKTGYPKVRGGAWLNSGDILFLSRGEKFIAETLCNVPDDAICSPHFYVIRVRNPEKLLPEFITWQINQVPSQKYLRQAAEGTGQLSIRRTILEKLKVAVPPLNLQERILEMANLVNREREVTELLIANRQQQLQFLAQELLVDDQIPAGGS
jgi:restriction endonuclease S subunit